MTRAAKSLLIALGLLLLVFMRTRGLAGKSLWVDEAISWHYAEQTVPGLIQAVATFDSHPPLFYLLVWVGHRLLPGEAGLRLPSLLAGLLLPWVIYRLAAITEGKATALRACILSALATYLTCFSQESRNYCFTAFLSASSLLALIQFTKKPSWRTWLPWTLCCMLCLYTYLYLSLFLFILAGWWFWKHRVKDRRMSGLWLTSHVLAACLFLPWIPALLSKTALQGLNPGWRPGFGFWDLTRVVNTFSIGPHQYLSEALPPTPLSVALFSLPWAGLFIGGLWVSRERRLWATIMIGVPFLIWILPVHLHRFDPKHIFFLLPFFIICQSKAIEKAKTFLFQGLCLGLLLLFNLASWVWVQSPSFGKASWDEATLWVSQEGRPEDLVLFDPFYVGYAFDFYVPRDCSIQDRFGPTGTMGDLQENSLIEEVKDVAKPWQRIWLVSSQGPVTVPSPRLFEWLTQTRPVRDAIQYAPAGCMETILITSLDREKRP